MSTFNCSRLVAVWPLVILWGIQPCLASGDSSATEDSASSDRIQEIVVTAQRREENLEKVPIAVTVVSQDTLDHENVQTLGDLQYLVPSMSATSVYSRDGINLSIRGQQATPSSTVQAVVTYLNEVPIPTSVGGDVAGGPGMLFDLENVQVLKGPQGTLFGRNSTGGAVLFQTARPKADYGGELQVTYGNYNDREINGMLNLPLVGDVLLTRIAFSGQLRDGFTHLLGDPNHPNGTDADNRDYWSLRDTLTFRPNDVFQDDLIVSGTHYVSHGSPTFLTTVNPTGITNVLSNGALVTYLAEQQSLGPRVALAEDTPLVSDGSNLGVENISRVALGDNLTFRNIAGYDREITLLAQEFDGTVLPLLDNIYSMTKPFTTDQYSDEAQLLGTSFANNLDWILGAFYLHSHQTEAGTSTYFFTHTGAYSEDIQSSKALFGQGTYDLSAWIPNLKVRAGVRNTWDRESNGSQVCPAGSIVAAFTDNPNCTAAADYRVANSAVTWTLGLDYQLNPETLLYLASRRGYRAGSFNSGEAAVVAPQFGPEYVLDQELGLKGDWRLGDMPLRANVALYHEGYTQIQVTHFVDQSTTAITGTTVLSVTGNDGDASILGAELELTAQPTKDLQVGTTFDYLNFKYTHFDPSVVNPTLDIAEQTENRPRFKYGVNARYRLPLNGDIGDVSVSGNWNWQAKSAVQLLSAQDLAYDGYVGAFGLLNVSADWNNIARMPFDASFFMSNALDKVYRMGGSSLYTLVGVAADKYGEPRMYGVRLRYRFGAQ